VGAPEPVWMLWRNILFLAPAGIQTPDRQARAIFTTLIALSLLLVTINKQHKFLCYSTFKAPALHFAHKMILFLMITTKNTNYFPKQH
jgi:hypothetical protein